MKKFILAALVVIFAASFTQSQAMPNKNNIPPAKPKMEKMVPKHKPPHVMTDMQQPPVIVQQVPVVYENYNSYSSSGYYSQPNISFSNDKMSISIGF